MKRIFYAILLMFGLSASAETHSMGSGQVVSNIKISGPVTVQKPFMLDSINAAQKSFNDADIMFGDVYTATFSFSTSSWTNAEIKVPTPIPSSQGRGASSVILVDGKEVKGKQGYQPGQYDVEIRFVSSKDSVGKFAVSIDADKPIKTFVPKAGAKRPFSLMDNMLMSHYNDIALSMSGKYALVTSSHMNTKGETEYKTRIINTQTGALVRFLDTQEAQWLHKTDRYIVVRKNGDKRELYAVNPLTLNETLLNDNVPEGDFIITPTDDALIMMQDNEGPKHADGVYEVLNMEDRQPGYRKRKKLAKYDLNTSILQPLTFGNDAVMPVDVTEDGQTLYFSTHENIFSTERPTDRVSLYKMNLSTLKTDTVFYREGYIDEVTLIPNSNKILVMGCADAFKGIGRNLPADRTPNIWEHQLFLFDTNTKAVTPLTKDFDPSVNNVAVGHNGMVYFTAAVADSIALFSMNLNTKKINRINQPVEVIDNCVISDNGSTLLYYGSGACTPYRLYSLKVKELKSEKVEGSHAINLKSSSINLLDDLNKKEMADVELGTCQGWRFKSKSGYELTGHVYLPAHFDATKKYPMLVHYYGGCTATERLFGCGTRYPAHYWNALGYIVLIVNPSGAAGFGQEWGSRHVNTAGEGPAQDIIEATQWYCDNNSFVDKKALGCISASYGGFMTQWILTKTDMFAAGVSHAGISDHTSYWGNGYWGYSYSEVSMANSFPWNRKDLYVDRSPLYNADKIHTPLLFTHGTADTNVPVMESIQMFTALKLLQRPTALVLVDGQNHWILEYNKKQKWINTIMAWFQKYLKHDDSWWNALYSPKDF